MYTIYHKYTMYTVYTPYVYIYTRCFVLTASTFGHSNVLNWHASRLCLWLEPLNALSVMCLEPLSALSPWTHSQWCEPLNALSMMWAPERTLSDVSPWTHSQWCEPLNALSVMCLEPLNALSMMRAPERTLSDVSRAPERTLNDASPWTHSQWCVLSPWTHSQWCATPQHICRVGQNLIYTPYMTVHFLISLPKIPYVHRRVGQNHIYTVYIRYLRQGNHQVYGHINNYGQLYVLTHLLDLFRLLAQSILFDRCPACLAGSFWRCPCHRWAVRALFTKKGTLEQQRWTMPKNTS